MQINTHAQPMSLLYRMDKILLLAGWVVLAGCALFSIGRLLLSFF